MAKLTKSQRILAYLCLALISFALFTKFFSRLRGEINTLDKRIRLAEAKLNKYSRIQGAKDEIAAASLRAQPYLKLADMGEKQIIAELLSEVESIASASGASIFNLNPQEKPEDNRTYKKYRADFRLEGSFSQLLSFLSKLQESSLLIKIDKLSVISKDERTALLRIDGVVSLAVPS